MSTGDCSLYGGCGDAPPVVTLPFDVNLSGGSGPAAVVELNGDGSGFAGIGAGLGLKGKSEVDVPSQWLLSPGASASRDMLTFRFGNEPYGATLRIDLGAGVVFGGSGTLYVNSGGISFHFSSGLVDGASGTITAGNRWRPSSH